MSANISICQAAETYAKDPMLISALATQLMISVLTIGLLIAVFMRTRFRKIALHTNVKVSREFSLQSFEHFAVAVQILLLNVTALYAIESLNTVQAYSRTLVSFGSSAAMN